MNYSPEPWKLTDIYQSRFINDANGNGIGSTSNGLVAETACANAERIVACVNFCRQFPTEWLAEHQLQNNQSYTALQVVVRNQDATERPTQTKNQPTN